MNKIISISIIAYLSISSLSAQTQYWNGFREPSGKLGAVYMSEDETQSDRIERRFYTKRGRKLVDAQILSLEPPHKIVGNIYYWPNGQESQEILYDESGMKTKSVHYWDEDAKPLGAENYLPDSSGFARCVADYPNGETKYRTHTQYETFSIQKAGWYPNGSRWFETQSSKGQITSIAAYDTLGNAIDLNLLAEDKITWQLDPEILNPNEVMQLIGYPQLARHEGIQGKVRFRLLVSPEGKVLTYKLIESPGDILTMAVEQYLWDIAFSPAQSEAGNDVYGWVDYFADFKLLN